MYIKMKIIINIVNNKPKIIISDEESSANISEKFL